MDKTNCNSQQSHLYPPLDLFESFRLMLSCKENFPGKILSCLPDSKSEKFSDLQLRWFLLRLYCDFNNHLVDENTDYKALLMKTEQVIDLLALAYQLYIANLMLVQENGYVSWFYI